MSKCLVGSYPTQDRSKPAQEIFTTRAAAKGNDDSRGLLPERGGGGHRYFSTVKFLAFLVLHIIAYTVLHDIVIIWQTILIRVMYNKIKKTVCFHDLFYGEITWIWISYRASYVCMFNLMRNTYRNAVCTMDSATICKNNQDISLLNISIYNPPPPHFAAHGLAVTLMQSVSIRAVEAYDK